MAAVQAGERTSQVEAEKLKGRVAFVTGGTRGIGAAIGRSLAMEGATVAAGYSQQRGGGAGVQGGARGARRCRQHPPGRRRQLRGLSAHHARRARAARATRHPRQQRGHHGRQGDPEDGGRRLAQASWGSTCLARSSRRRRRSGTCSIAAPAGSSTSPRSSGRSATSASRTTRRRSRACSGSQGRWRARRRASLQRSGKADPDGIGLTVELCRARIHRDGDARHGSRKGARQDPGTDPARSPRSAGGGRACRALPVRGRLLLHHGPGLGGQRRSGDVGARLRLRASAELRGERRSGDVRNEAARDASLKRSMSKPTGLRNVRRQAQGRHTRTSPQAVSSSRYCRVPEPSPPAASGKASVASIDRSTQQSGYRTTAVRSGDRAAPTSPLTGPGALPRRGSSHLGVPLVRRHRGSEPGGD